MLIITDTDNRGLCANVTPLYPRSRLVTPTPAQVTSHDKKKQGELFGKMWKKNNHFVQVLNNLNLSFHVCVVTQKVRFYAFHQLHSAQYWALIGQLL